MKVTLPVIFTAIFICAYGCQTTPHNDQQFSVHQYQTYESGPILSKKEWAAKYRPQLASQKHLSPGMLKRLREDYDQYVRLKLANRNFDIKQRETEANIRLLEAQTKLLEVQSNKLRNQTVND